MEGCSVLYCGAVGRDGGRVLVVVGGWGGALL